MPTAHCIANDHDYAFRTVEALRETHKFMTGEQVCGSDGNHYDMVTLLIGGLVKDMVEERPFDGVLLWTLQVQRPQVDEESKYAHRRPVWQALNQVLMFTPYLSEGAMTMPARAGRLTWLLHHYRACQQLDKLLAAAQEEAARFLRAATLVCGSFKLPKAKCCSTYGSPMLFETTGRDEKLFEEHVAIGVVGELSAAAEAFWVASSVR